MGAIPGDATNDVDNAAALEESQSALLASAKASDAVVQKKGTKRRYPRPACLLCRRPACRRCLK